MPPEKIREDGREPGNDQNETLSPLLVGESAITPVLNNRGVLEGYSVVLLGADGTEGRKFEIDKKQGEDLLRARIALLASEVAHNKQIEDEADQALLPAYVAEAYRNKLRQMGVAEEDLPKTPSDMIIRSTKELEEYMILGKLQIAMESQGLADKAMRLIGQVFDGNQVIYNGLPEDFKKVIKFHLNSIAALAAQNSGINEETVDAARLALKINLLAHEKTREVILAWAPAIAEAGADTIATFFGNLIGTTGGAVAGSFEKAKEAVTKKKK